MINEKVTTDGKTIMDLLGEFYSKHQNDRNLIDKLIEAFKLEDGAQSAFLADNAQLINSLVGARQKTTSDLLAMLNTVQKLQANELNSDGTNLNDISDYMSNDDEDDNVEDLMSMIKKDNKGNKEIEKTINEISFGS